LDFFKRLQPFALLLMRLSLGTIMIAHGYRKVFGGFHSHQQFVAGLGLPAWMAYLSTGTEFFGGIAIVLGVCTQFFALAFLIEMATVIWKVHWKNGLTAPGGVEFPMACATIALALLCFGGGPWGFNFGTGAMRKTKSG
jgi:putative oxidoreductase